MSELERYKERLHIALNAAKVCIFEVDLAKQLYTFFENAEVIFGISGDMILKDVQAFQGLDPEAYQQACSEYFSHPDDEDVIKNAFESILSGKPVTYEARMKAGNSEFTWCRIDVVPVVENGRPARMVGVVTDISDAKEKMESLERDARLDDFTGLYKKGYAISLVKKELQRGQKREAGHALIVMDIDNFKMINDTYGHDQGDRIIRELVRRLKSEFRKTDIVSRFGGDEFLILMLDITDLESLRGKLRKLLRLRLDDLVFTNSVGVALYPQDAEDFDGLFKKADQALYRAKKSKESIVFFHEEHM